ncbi:MAG: HD-GYP domain-containing protein, partial [Gammaproteobacteria bacterium]|nr:HD-GYP domain-containing protein [Gammaproteobacteria bacterium]
VSDLKPGMYVSYLDRPWLDTPFPFQGFILTAKDIKQLNELCQYVYIDKEKSRVAPPPAAGVAMASSPASGELFERSRTVSYPRTTTRHEELKAAKTAYSKLTDVYDQLIMDVARNHKLNIPQLKGAIGPMVDSVVRNPDAFVLLTRLKRFDAYAYQHAMSCAVLAVATGRQIGLPKEMLHNLALGAALFDIGRARLPYELLARPRRLSEDELEHIQQHVQFSLDTVAVSEHITPDVLRMIETHHERHDGSGYPLGLSGDQIPLYGKIAGIVDCYDAITSNRPYATQVTPDEAIRMLYEWRDVEFQGALIEQFIQVIGVYPVGTLVELSDGRVGIVVAQHMEARLRPVVMVVLESNKQFAVDYYEFDMKKHQHGEDGMPLGISKCLTSGSYGIDPAEHFL